MPDLVLIRHGQSQWNLENRFTGFTDVDLSEKGRGEAARAGELLRERGVSFGRVYSSVLKRAIRTLWITLDGLDAMWLPQTAHWRLNERHYGALQGLNKEETAAKHGKEQVQIWRRSFDVRPPMVERTDPRHPANDPRYRGVDPALLPGGESLKDTLARVLPYWESDIAPFLAQGENILIAAHGNSLRAICKHLFKVSDQDIPHLEIPTGNPLHIGLDGGLAVLERSYLDESRAGELP